MEFHDPSYIYRVAPPYGNNRELPMQLMLQTLARLKSEQAEKSEKSDEPESPEQAEQALWQKAKEIVEAEHKMVSFDVQAVFMPDIDSLDRQIASLYLDHGKDKALELEAGKRLDQVRQKLKAINNLVIGGKPITTFDEFYAKAPPAMVQWLMGAIRCTMTLSQAEIKNFLPE